MEGSRGAAEMRERVLAGAVRGFAVADYEQSGFGGCVLIELN